MLNTLSRYIYVREEISACNYDCVYFMLSGLFSTVTNAMHVSIRELGLSQCHSRQSCPTWSGHDVIYKTKPSMYPAIRIRSVHNKIFLISEDCVLRKFLSNLIGIIESQA